MAGCIEDIFTSSPQDVLAFSTDTLSFDTVFTDLGTPTARLKVFNHAKKSVNISSIGMREPDTYFQMNVDGQSGRTFHDVEIRGGDSIFIFVECKLPEQKVNTPQLTSDAIVFITNGVEQQVELEAWGQNVRRLRGERIEADTRFTDELPIVVFDSLVVEKGAKLSLDPGVQLLFHDKAAMRVRGQLEAVGTAEKPIHLRGDRLDKALVNAPYDLFAGQWEGVTIAPESYGNRLEYVNMRSTVYGLRLDSVADASRSKLLMVNSWLHNSQGTVLEAKYASVQAYGCCFSEAADNVVALYGGEYDFGQCTFSNYYLFAVPAAPIVGLYHVLPSKALCELPLMTASFDNCIIYGMPGDLNEGDLNDTNVYLRYTLLRSEGSDDEHFISCLWGADPLFYTDRPEYVFNYRVRPESPAIGAGAPQYVPALSRSDMYGVDRLAAGAPTLGAFQYVAPPAEN